MSELTSWTAADFADSFQRHLPTGAVWPRDPDTTQRGTIQALMPTYQRSWALACDLPAETLPSSATDLLPEWEASLGLPDPCAGADATIAQRQNHVVARLTQSNGPSIPSLTAFAAALNPPDVNALEGEDGEQLTAEDGTELIALSGGYQITITEFAPARYGPAKYGQPCYGRPWAHAWQINAAGTTITPATYGSARYGDPYRTWGNAVLECEMRRLAPAHTVLLFAYSGSLTAGGWGQSPGWEHSGWAP